MNPPLATPLRRSRAGLIDTSPEAQRVLTEVHRAMAPERKWQMFESNQRIARVLHASGYATRQPGASAVEIRRDWLHLMYGSTFEASGRGEVMEQPAEVLAVLAEVVATLDRLGVPYALGGSMASGYYGEPRQTRDADITIEPPVGLDRDLPAAFDPAVYYLSPDAIRAALATPGGCFNLIHTLAGFKVDFYPRGARPFDHQVMARRRAVAFPGLADRPIRLISPEDSVLLKLEWYRMGGEVFDRQWFDVLGVLRVQEGRLDAAYMDHWATELGVADLLAEARAEAAG